MRVRTLLPAMALLAGCRKDRPLTAADEQVARALEGSWAGRFTVASLPYINRNPSSYRAINGSFVLLRNRYGAVHDDAIRLVTNYGTYDIDFRQLGIDLSQRSAIPTLLAGRTRGDSVELVLDPGNDNATMRLIAERPQQNRLKGRWSIVLDRVGAGSGTFAMARITSNGPTFYGKDEHR
jgi:hypothetical protein